MLLSILHKKVDLYRNTIYCCFVFSSLLFTKTTYSQSQIWNWGIEDIPNSTVYVKPNGLMQGLWFNYSSCWVGDHPSAPPVSFAGWEQTQPLYHGYCFEGVIASFMQYYKWPDRSQMNGYINKKPQFINHTWDYQSIPPQNYETDDVFNRMLQNCTVPGYCLVVNEIGRLYAAARIGQNTDYPAELGVGEVLDYSFEHILRNRFGFVNARMVSSPTIDMLIEQIETKKSPVIQFYSGHSWILDGHKVENGIHYFHKLEGSGSQNRHPAYWVESNDISRTINFIFDLNPGILLSGNQGVVKEFLYGEAQLPRSAGTMINTRLRLVRSPNSNTSGTINVIIKEQRWNGSNWYDASEKVSSTDLQLLSTGAVTNTFPLEIPSTGSVKLIVYLTNRVSTTADFRIIFEEPNAPEAIVFKNNNGTVIKLEQDGTLIVPSGCISSPQNGASGDLSIVDLIANWPTGTLSTGGNFHADLTANDAQCLDDDDPLAACSRGSLRFVFNKSAHAMSFRREEVSGVSIRKNFYDKATIRPVSLGNLEPRGFIYSSAVTIPYRINWGLGPNSQVQNVRLLWQKEGETSWELISDNVNAQQMLFDWQIPALLMDYNIFLRVEDRNNAANYDISKGTIKIIEGLKELHVPSSGTVLNKGQQIDFKWEFIPRQTVYSFFTRPAQRARDLYGVGTSDEHHLWTIPSNWPTNELWIKIQDYGGLVKLDVGPFEVR